jgi:hypothetical protein
MNWNGKKWKWQSSLTDGTQMFIIMFKITKYLTMSKYCVLIKDSFMEKLT